MKRVIIESPFAGNTHQNIMYAKACMSDCIKMHKEAPIAFHLLYPQAGILNDQVPLERQVGFICAQRWYQCADAVVVYLDHGVSEGMRVGINFAIKLNLKIVYRRLDSPNMEVSTLEEAMALQP